MLKVYKGGMSFYGASIAVVTSSFIYSLKNKVSYLRVLDLAACAAPIGISLVEQQTLFINNYMANQQFFLGIIFPMIDSVPRHPNQIHEALLEGFILFIIVFASIRFFSVLRVKGGITYIFTILQDKYFRFIAEFTRDDPKTVWDF